MLKGFVLASYKLVLIVMFLFLFEFYDILPLVEVSINNIKVKVIKVEKFSSFILKRQNICRGRKYLKDVCWSYESIWTGCVFALLGKILKKACKKKYAAQKTNFNP